MTLYYKMKQILLHNTTIILLQNTTKAYYKRRQRFYYKMRQLLQNVTIITKCDVITKCVSTHYEQRYYIKFPGCVTETIFTPFSKLG